MACCKDKYHFVNIHLFCMWICIELQWWICFLVWTMFKTSLEAAKLDIFFKLSKILNNFSGSVGTCLIFLPSGYRASNGFLEGFGHRIEVPSNTVGSTPPISQIASSAKENASSVGCLSFASQTRGGRAQERRKHLPSLTFLGYLYGAVTDFTCCCSSLVSCSGSWDTNWGVRTTNAFTTCNAEPEAQGECQPTI